MTPSLEGVNCGIDYYSPMWWEFYMQELFNLVEEPDWIYTDTAYYLQPAPIVFFESENSTESISGIADKDFQVELFFDSLTTTSFQVGDYKMDFKYNGWLQPNGITNIYYKDKLFIQFPYLNGIDWHEGAPLKFTFRFLHGMLFFYVNGQLIHNREAEKSEAMAISVFQAAETFNKIVASSIQ